MWSSEAVSSYLPMSWVLNYPQPSDLSLCTSHMDDAAGEILWVTTPGVDSQPHFQAHLHFLPNALFISWLPLELSHVLVTIRPACPQNGLYPKGCTHTDCLHISLYATLPLHWAQVRGSIASWLRPSLDSMLECQLHLGRNFSFTHE